MGKLHSGSTMLLFGLCVSLFALTPQVAEATQLATPALLATNDAQSSASLGPHRLDLPSDGMLLTQYDDAYDPFADYSEFEESSEEEEDLNFFRNGRLLTIGFIGGYRGWTGNFSQIYTSDVAFGLYLTYFFDLRFALQFGYLTSDHILSIPRTSGSEAVQGNLSISDISFLLKYYFNTANVTRGLADLNPYLVGGFSQLYRTTTVAGDPNFGRDQAFAFNIGAGIEFPMLKNKMYFGGQAVYQLVNFSNESQMIVDVDDNPTGLTAAGDSFNILGILGINF